MKLAFCLFNYFPYGGLQRDFMRIANACLARGHEVHVMTMRWEGEKPPAWHIDILPVSGMSNHARISAFATAVKDKLATEHFDLVIGFNKMPHLDVYYAADVCFQARAREKHRWYYRLLPRYMKLVAFEKAIFVRGQKTEILLISPLQQSVFEHYYQTESTRFHLLPPGIAVDRKAPVNAITIRERVRSQQSITKDQFLLLMVGSGFKTKGVDRAIKALASLPQSVRECCQLMIIGQDNPASFKRLAAKKGLAQQVRFLGGRNDVADFLLAADLLLHPAYHENTGTVLLEAMIAGLPVLTVDVCGYAHYVESAEAGKVIPSPFQQNELNQTLQTMLLSKERTRWHHNGILFGQTADIYSLPEKAAQLIEQIGRQRDLISAS